MVWHIIEKNSTKLNSNTKDSVLYCFVQDIHQCQLTQFTVAACPDNCNSCAYSNGIIRCNVNGCDDRHAWRESNGLCHGKLTDDTNTNTSSQRHTYNQDSPIYPLTYPHTHPHTHTPTCTYPLAHTHLHIPTYTHTHMHTHTYTLKIA